MFQAIRKVRYAQQHMILVSSSSLIRPGNGLRNGPKNQARWH